MKLQELQRFTAVRPMRVNQVRQEAMLCIQYPPSQAYLQLPLDFEEPILTDEPTHSVVPKAASLDNEFSRGLGLFDSTMLVVGAEGYEDQSMTITADPRLLVRPKPLRLTPLPRVLLEAADESARGALVRLDDEVGG